MGRPSCSPALQGWDKEQAMDAHAKRVLAVLGRNTLFSLSWIFSFTVIGILLLLYHTPMWLLFSIAVIGGMLGRIFLFVCDRRVKDDEPLFSRLIGIGLPLFIRFL
jgi:hypothetical protein